MAKSFGWIWDNDDRTLSFFKILFAFLTLLAAVTDYPKVMIAEYFLPDFGWVKSLNASDASVRQMAEAAKAAATTTIYVFLMVLFVVAQMLLWSFKVARDNVNLAAANEAESLSKKFEPESQKIELLASEIQQVKDRIDRPGKLQKIKIAIFDKMLIYSPLFVAREMKYFEEEGLDVEFNIIGSDREIAKSVSENESQFGACDPYFCIDGFSRDSNPKVQVLIPLAKRLGLKIVGKKSGETVLTNGAKIVIGSYSAGSTTFLAASAFKSWLETALSATGVQCEVSIDAKPIDDKCFSSPSQLKAAMKTWNFAAIWEPNVSWLIDDPSQDYGVVGVSVDEPAEFAPVLQIFEGQRPSGAIGFLSDRRWKAWLPGSSDTMTAHKCLVSALITSRNIITREPELARRVFRAVSRANIHLHALDEVEDASSSNPLWSKIQGTLNHGELVKASVLQTLVGQTSTDMSATDRGGVIPFVPGLSHYSERHYFSHLKACHRLWKENGGSEIDVFPVDSDYEKFFVKTSEFALNAH